VLGSAIRRVVSAARPPNSSPAMDFGRHIRQIVDSTPDSTAGALAIGKLLRLDPTSKEIDQLKVRFQITEREIEHQKQEIRQLQEQKEPVVPQPRCEQQEIATKHGQIFPHTPPPRPQWVDLPLNPECRSECGPRPDVIRLIEDVLPSFSNHTDPLAWKKVAELVIADGRTADECAAMGWDELFAVFDRLRKNKRGPGPCERLAKLWDTEEGKVFLRTAKDIETIGKRIGKGLTVTKGSPFFKSVIAPERKAYKACAKYEACEAKVRADRAREKANARGGRRGRNRPRNRPSK